MKKYDLLDIALKILGLSLVPNLIVWIGQAIIMIPASFFAFGEAFSFYPFLAAAFGALLYIFPVYFFIFRTNFVLRMIRVKDDEHTVNMAVQRSVFIEMALIVIGGVALIKSLPSLCGFLLQQIQIRKLDLPDNNYSNQWITTEIITILFSVIIIAYAKPLSRFFSGREVKQEHSDTVE